MKCIRCRSDVKASYGRCYICGTLIKDMQTISSNISKENEKKSDYKLLSSIFGAILFLALVVLLIDKLS